MIERYSLPEMSSIWEDRNKYEIWKQIEIYACEARMNSDDIPPEDFEQIKNKADFDPQRIFEIEQTTHHDVIAFLTNMAEYIGPASRYVHYGMTSSDVLDTALSVQMKQAGELLQQKLQELKNNLRLKAIEHKYSYCIGRTHGVHAEPTTMGLKFVLWYEEIKRNIRRLKAAIYSVSVCKISGAVGTYDHLSPDVEAFVAEKLNLQPAPVATQVVQRDRHAEYLSVLAIIAGSLEKIATEIRHLQKTEVLEAEEPFGKGQKGSSAMPHKKNPILCERIAGLARVIRSNAQAGFENIALWHERDITHSSVERIILPDSCGLLYYMLHLTNKVISGMSLYPENMLKNINKTRGLIFSQKVLLKLTEKGFTREEAYAIVQRSAMAVWENENTDLLSLLLEDNEVKSRIDENELLPLFDLRNALRNIDAVYMRTVEAE